MDLVFITISALWKVVIYGLSSVFVLLFGLALIVLLRRQFGIGTISNKALAERIQIRLVHDHRATDPLIEELRQFEIWADHGDWDRIAARLGEWDQSRRALATGHRATPMAIEACLAPLERALDVEHETGVALSSARLEDYLRDYEMILETMPDNPMLALICAEAHMKYGWDAMFPGGSNEMSFKGWKRAQPHYQRAAQLLDPLDARSLNSPAIARAQYYISLGSEDGDTRAQKAALIWEELDPGDTALFLDHGYHLSPAWFGDYAELDRAARAAAERRKDEFGKGAYALMYFRPMFCDGDAWKSFDIELIIESALDLARSSGSQWWVNHVASWLWDNSLKGPFAYRGNFAAAFAPLCREDLYELAPALWRDSANLVLRNISGGFPEELSRGASLRFTPGGIQVQEPQAA
jgi:hypothetical protein